MAISSETIGRLYASGRNYVNLFIGFASGVGIVNAAQQKEIMDSLTEIYNGVSMIIHGGTSLYTVLAVLAAPIVGPILARWASNSAKVDNQAQAVKAAMADPNTPVSPIAKAAAIDAVQLIPEVKDDQKIKVDDPVLVNLTESNNVVLAK